QVRGYLITIRCTTPNAGRSSYVQQQMVNELLKFTLPKAIAEKKLYYVAKAAISTEVDVKDDQSRANGAVAGASYQPQSYAAPQQNQYVGPVYRGGGGDRRAAAYGQRGGGEFRRSPDPVRTPAAN